ncbi:MAG TPA: SRPBCC family protein [Pirellulales bacterium]|jgi:hypothetical protein
MFIYILAAVVAAIVVLVVTVAAQPSAFSISRSSAIAAPAAAVFPHVNDFHNWEAWSPWVKIDPNSQVAFEGPSSGKGAIFRWEGNRQVGTGSMLITESRPNDLILIDLIFLKPFRGKNVTEFTFKPDGDQTVVNWTMTGKSAFIPKLFCFCFRMNMDKMVGCQFEKGLASMKSVVESSAGK